MKKIINKLINLLGYTIAKSHPTRLFKKQELVQVYDYKILMPSINPLIITYNQQKNFASELGRIVKIIYSKYSELKILDIGANVGDTVAIIKSSIDVPIVCVEGDKFTYSFLIKNVTQFKNVTTINTFLGETNATLKVSINKAGWNTTLIPALDSSESVNLQTLDSIIKGLEYTELYKFLKIDTEGFDTIILRGALDFIKKAKPVIYLEYNRDNMRDINEDGLPTILQLQELGYNDILFFDDRGRFITATNLNDKKGINFLDNYADGTNGLIYYYNMCIFHEDDSDIANDIIIGELLYNKN